MRAIQLAKAALYAGARLLMDHLGRGRRGRDPPGRRLRQPHRRAPRDGPGPRPGLRPGARLVHRQCGRDRGAHRAAVRRGARRRSRPSCGASRRSRPRSSRGSRSTSWRRWRSRTGRAPHAQPRARRGPARAAARPPPVAAPAATVAAGAIRIRPDPTASTTDADRPRQPATEAAEPEEIPMTEDTTHRRSGGRAARQAARAHLKAQHVPFLTRKLAPFEVLCEEGLVAHRGERGHDPRRRWAWSSAATRTRSTLLAERRCRRPGRARPLPARPVPVHRPGVGAARVHAARPQPGAQRPHRRQRHGLRAGLRLAVRARPRRRPALRDDRGLPQLREARLPEPVPPPQRRHRLRAGRPAGQQAPLRHGRGAPAVQRQAVHGLRDPRRRGRRTRWRWRGSCSGPTTSRTTRSS